jgi:predicted CxxxxCH...CXXCH cytochrome family protein
MAAALVGAVALAGCYGGGSKSSSGTDSGAAKGVTGQFWFVNLFTPPVGGVITSDVGGINCGASGSTVNSTVSPPQYTYAYYGATGSLTDHCGQNRFEWPQTVVLTASGQGGNAFLGWAGDCTGTGTCTLKAGADKTVVAIFGKEGGGHGNFLDPAVHAPSYFAFLSGTGPLKCNTCHGPTLAGQGIAPSCSSCHEQVGWTGWQTNCSFCHGAKTALAKAGYALASHPEWSAPPDAISQRLTGAAAPDRTGAHQAHLLGVTPSGLSVAPPFTCATCHPVPTDVTHVSGADARANVVLSGAGQATLPASLGNYDPATGTCATYCHGTGGSPAWSATGMQCAGCHGVPPASHTVTGLTTCVACHPGTVDATGAIIPGGQHLDGIRQGGHGTGYSNPALHGPDALANIASCKTCHGANYEGDAGPSCNACHTGSGWTGWATNCSFCHGTKDPATMAGYAVATHPTWSAPPDAVAQRLDPVHAPVTARTGAHQIHLVGGPFAQPFACATCHAVPTDLSHVNGPTAHATVALTGAGQAQLPANLGAYAPASGTCTTYCHGSGPSPTWSSTGLVCGACHALPPASPHPSVPGGVTACYLCHGETVKPDGTIDVAAGKHLNGTLDGGGHAAGFDAAAVHGPQFFSSLRGTVTDCRSCHGATFDGVGTVPSCNACHLSNGWTASWQTNCSFCHGTRNTFTRTTPYTVTSEPTLSAPPDALSQRLTGVADPSRTGAHQSHLTGKGSASSAIYVTTPIACATCHTVPGDYAHAGGPGPAPVVLKGTGTLPTNLGTYTLSSGTCTTYCHGSTIGNTLPVAWSAGELGCAGCHGNPPQTGQHNLHVNGNGNWCTDCHAGTVFFDNTIVGTGHVNGLQDVLFYSPGSTWDGNNCTASCHPPDIGTVSWR